LSVFCFFEVFSFAFGITFTLNRIDFACKSPLNRVGAVIRSVFDIDKTFDAC